MVQGWSLAAGVCPALLAKAGIHPGSIPAQSGAGSVFGAGFMGRDAEGASRDSQEQRPRFCEALQSPGRSGDV